MNAEHPPAVARHVDQLDSIEELDGIEELAQDSEPDTPPNELTQAPKRPLNIPLRPIYPRSEHSPH